MCIWYTTVLHSDVFNFSHTQKTKEEIKIKKLLQRNPSTPNIKKYTDINMIRLTVPICYIFLGCIAFLKTKVQPSVETQWTVDLLKISIPACSHPLFTSGLTILPYEQRLLQGVYINRSFYTSIKAPQLVTYFEQSKQRQLSHFHSQK